MNNLIAVSDPCPHCQTALLESDHYCRQCGLPIGDDSSLMVQIEGVADPNQPFEIPGPRLTADRKARPSPIARVLKNRIALIAILLCVGPMGLPALWFSPRFTRRAKIGLTAVFFFFTAVLPLAIAWYLLDVAVRPVVEVLQA